MEKLKKDWKGEGYVRRGDSNLNLLQSLYTRYAKNKTGMLNRDDRWWKLRVLNDPSEIVIAYDADGHAEGYLMYSIKENVFQVHEMIDCTLNAKKMLLQFIANHDSMVSEARIIVPSDDNLSLIIDDPTFEQRVEPWFMARIVDVHAFLSQYPFQEKSVSQSLFLHIDDDFFPENSGTYEIDSIGKDKSIHYQGQDMEKSGVRCSIQQLTVMLMGYKRPMELFQAGLIDGDEETIMQLEELIPFQQTFFADFF